MQLLLEIDPTDNNPKALNLRKTIGPVGGYFVQIEFKALRWSMGFADPSKLSLEAQLDEVSSLNDGSCLLKSFHFFFDGASKREAQQTRGKAQYCFLDAKLNSTIEELWQPLRINQAYSQWVPRMSYFPHKCVINSICSCLREAQRLESFNQIKPVSSSHLTRWENPAGARFVYRKIIHFASSRLHFTAKSFSWS